MKQVYWTLVGLLSHWRRRPANFAALFVGLAIATALWSGVQALNEHARKSYDRAASVFGGGDAQSLVPTSGGRDCAGSLRQAAAGGLEGVAGARRNGSRSRHSLPADRDRAADPASRRSLWRPCGRQGFRRLYRAAGRDHRRAGDPARPRRRYRRCGRHRWRQDAAAAPSERRRRRPGCSSSTSAWRRRCSTGPDSFRD